MSTPAPQVRIAAGLVRVTADGGVFAFRDIPYARPVGNLRSAAPAPAVPWECLRDASVFGPPPPQSSLAGVEPAASVDYLDSDEWLTVNVWSPDPRADGLPVMVWIRGGAYMFGSSANPTYNGARMAREGNVVVVTFKLRVTVEGFTQLRPRSSVGCSGRSRGLASSPAPRRRVQS